VTVTKSGSSRYQWEHSSGGRCLFLFAVAQDDQGRDVFKQVQDKLA
jgi:type III restriction enzyme